HPAQLPPAAAHHPQTLHAPEAPHAAPDRRKPGPGMLREALAQFRVAPHDAVMIGDNLVDLQAATAAGVARILVRTGKGAAMQARGLPPEVLPVAVRADLADAVDRLLADMPP
ncbi:MAG: HAD hydrolase-like protein, partial [Ferrovibrionaceae bacterium]